MTLRSAIHLCLLIAIGMAVVVLAGPSQAADLSFAQKNFQELCSPCHGPKGFGDGPSGATLATHPRNFHDCALMAKDSDDFVFKEIKGGSASVGRSKDMPAWGEVLEPDQIRSFIAYVRTFCAGGQQASR